MDMKKGTTTSQVGKGSALAKWMIKKEKKKTPSLKKADKQVDALEGEEKDGQMPSKKLASLDAKKPKESGVLSNVMADEEGGASKKKKRPYLND